MHPTVLSRKSARILPYSLRLSFFESLTMCKMRLCAQPGAMSVTPVVDALKLKIVEELQATEEQ